MYGLSLIPFQALSNSNTASNAAPATEFSISATLTQVNKNQLFIRYHLEGDLTLIQWPGHAASAERQENLWQATCFECFISNADDTTYYEVNLAPNHAWHTFKFSDYRKDMTSANNLNLSAIHGSQSDTSFQLSSFITLSNAQESDAQHAPLVTEKTTIGITAVILDKNNIHHYYALKHSADKPDFHDRHSHSLNAADFKERL